MTSVPWARQSKAQGRLQPAGLGRSAGFHATRLLGMMTFRMPSLVVLVCITFMATGCKSLGPRTIRADRFNYNQEGAQSGNEQMLLNLLRVRYGEPIYFLEVASMLSQYTFVAGAELSRWENDLNVWKNPALRAIYAVDSDPSAQDTWAVNLSYSDRPTITYAPLQGEAFANRVMSPIPPATVFYLSQSGWSIDRLLECCVQRIGNTRNAPIHDIREADFWSTVKFRTIAALLKKIQDAGRLQLSVEVDPTHQVSYLYPARDVTGFEEEALELSELLGIALDVERLKIVPGGSVAGKNELVMQTRSLLGVLNALAQAITPPDKHKESGQVLTASADEEEVLTRPWLTVEHSIRPHAGAFVQVYYNGYWWFIRKTDWTSKRTFALLAYLFSLQASETAAALPVVTVQAGG